MRRWRACRRRRDFPGLQALHFLLVIARLNFSSAKRDRNYVHSNATLLHLVFGPFSSRIERFSHIAVVLLAAVRCRCRLIMLGCVLGLRSRFWLLYQCCSGSIVLLPRKFRSRRKRRSVVKCRGILPLTLLTSEWYESAGVAFVAWWGLLGINFVGDGYVCRTHSVWDKLLIPVLLLATLQFSWPGIL